MNRQRPSAGYNYSTTCGLPREKEETKSSSDTKKEAVAAKAETKKDDQESKYAGSQTCTLIRPQTIIKRDTAELAAAVLTETKLDEDKESDGSSSSSDSDKDKDNEKDKDEPAIQYTAEDSGFSQPNPQPNPEKDPVYKPLLQKFTATVDTGFPQPHPEKDPVYKTSLQKFTATDDSGFPQLHHKKIPVVDPSLNVQTYQRTAVMRTPRPLPPPTFFGRPLVLATHLVPSLPVGLFEVLVEAIEAATGRAVVILYEPRPDRPVCTEVADIAILPAGEKWESGNLLPVSFVFDHHLNKSFSPAVYADVVVATDRAPHVETLLDLRGHRCALPDRKRKIGATTLLFNYLHSKGEGPAFFGNTLDANSQVSALQMVAGKQVEVCVLESPVIKFHRQSLPGVYSLHILSSLGPLPPYPIMANKSLSSEIIEKIKTYLLNIHKDSVWLEKFAPYSVLGFAEYNRSRFDFQEMKPVVTSAPYY